jgi:hypothetical protein
LLVCTLIVGSATTWSVLASFRGTRPIVGTIQQAHGLLDLRGNSGGQASRIDAGQQVFAGDILESKSCDSWLEMDIASDSKLTLASHSSVRMLQAANALSQDYELLRGGLWVDCRMDQSKKVRIVTPTATIESANGAFNVRVTETETVLWVHRGQATVFQAKDGQSASLQAGVELSMDLENSGTLSIKPQSPPTNSWVLTWPLDHQIVYGKVLNNFKALVQLCYLMTQCSGFAVEPKDRNRFASGFQVRNSKAFLGVSSKWMYHHRTWINQVRSGKLTYPWTDSRPCTPN